jgi:hypothetical protein
MPGEICLKFFNKRGKGGFFHHKLKTVDLSQKLWYKIFMFAMQRKKQLRDHTPGKAR